MTPNEAACADTSYYYTRDHLGSVREMCSSTGTITSRMAYDPYGRTTTVSGTVLPTKQYAGYYQHQTSGLALTEYRAFDSSKGNWLSRDPNGESGGIDLYSYCSNDPTDEKDTLGLCGSLTVVFAPNGGATKPTIGPDNLPVIITFHDDNCCCKHIKFIQRYTSNGGHVQMDGTPAGGGTMLQPDHPDQAGPPSPFYPFQGGIYAPDQNSMYDDPAYPDGADDVSFFASTCAFCVDTGKYLACAGWGFSVHGHTQSTKGAFTRPPIPPLIP